MIKTTYHNDYHLTASAYYAVLGNVPTWCIVYSVNGRYYTATKYAGYNPYDNRYVSTERGALTWGIYYAECMVDRLRRENMVRRPQNAHQRLVALCDLLKYDQRLQKLVTGVYPSSLMLRVKIECERKHQPALQEAIAHLTDGIAIEWKAVDRSRFTGLIETVGETKESAA